MIKVESHFEGAAIEIVDALQATKVRLKIPKDANSCTRQWFYFSISTPAPEKHSIELVNAEKVSFPMAWEGYQAFASYDNEEWFRVETRVASGRLTIEHEAVSDTVYYAYFVPYSLARQRNLLQSIEHHPFVAIEALTKSPLGHNIDLIKVGEPAKNKKNVWLIARQHPGESMAQWVAEGFLRELIENRAGSNIALDDYCFFIVTNMNPDGTQLGCHRSNYHGKNLNRCWADASLEACPEVYYVQDAMYKYGVDFFFDIHGDESIPHNFIMLKGDTGKGEQIKQSLARLDPNFQLKHDYDSYATSCGTSCCNSSCNGHKTATGFVSKKLGAVALLLEASFKNLQDGYLITEWDHRACISLGRNVLLALTQNVSRKAN